MDPLKRAPANLESNREKKICLHEGEDVQETADHELILQTSGEDAGQLNLSLLPNEILLKIINHLSPVDLISLVKLNDKRLTELTYTVRQANFSACRTADPAFVSLFFTRDRVKLIQKLNFNHYFYLKPPELTNFICRCKNLKSLSVVGCRLTFVQIYHILQSCEQLEELAWNITAIPKQDFCCFSNLKKLYLFREYLSDHPLKTPFLKAFPQVEHVWVDFDYDCNHSALPFVGMWSMTTAVSNEEKSKHLMIMAGKGMYTNFSWTSNVFKFVLEMITKQLFERRNFRELCDPDNPINSIVSVPPYLQFRSSVGDLQSVSSGPSKSYSTLVIHMTDEFLKVSENLVKCVQEIAGVKLKRLSFLVHEFRRLRNELVECVKRKEYIANCDKTCDVMEQIFSTSKYITVLNLTTVHFSTNSPIKAITMLEYLKVLNLPSCAFKSNMRKNDSENLSSVVSACARITEFVLYCCSESASILTSDDVVCIQNWSRLEHLSVIYSLIVLRSFAFLQKVADSCIQLSSLTLIALPSCSASLFTNDVIYLLKKAKNLRFIRINDVKFNPVFERFWPAIGEAVGLEGICITTKSTVPVTAKVVIDEIKKLKYLHLFHFQANVPHRFSKEVKKSMQDHGIQNITCEKKCILPDDVGISYSTPMEAYHRRPYISECSRLHLKDIDLF